MSQWSQTDPGIRLTDQEFFDISKIVQDMADGVKAGPGGDFEFRGIFTDRDFETYDSRYVYKFMTEDTYEKYASKGSFRLSSLERFRRYEEEENNPAGDRFEGRTYCCYSVTDYDVSVATLAGFDMLIYSTTRNLANKEAMKRKFGPVVLRIELTPFQRILESRVGCVCSAVRLVRYADLKMYRGRLSPRDIDGTPPIPTPRLARALRKRGRLPAVYAKPSRFEEEREARLGFLMNADVRDTCDIYDQRLLKYVTRLE